MSKPVRFVCILLMLPIRGNVMERKLSSFTFEMKWPA